MDESLTPRAPLHPDAAVIDAHGGPAALARALGPDYTIQRVQNWKYRGIPEVIQLRRPDLFPAEQESGKEAA